MKNIKIFSGIILALFLAACSTTRAPSLNMLEKRADYNGKHQVNEVISEFEPSILIPNRTSAKVADIWIHPHEMPTGDYFRGGWIRTLISKSKWQMERVEIPDSLNEKPEIKKKKKRKKKAGKSIRYMKNKNLF